MDRRSMFDLPAILDHLEKSSIDANYQAILKGFMERYAEALRHAPIDLEKQKTIVLEFVDAVETQCNAPHHFEPFHKHLPAHQTFGCAFIGPLIDMKQSKIFGKESLKKIEDYLARGENVVFFSNHQIEADPHILFTLLKDYPFSKEIIFVAGERVVLDPLAVPLSLGCNLLCIYSKKYIDYPPEKRAEKQEHNRSTMQIMREKLSEGGACIWVAPSGGRDRKSSDGRPQPATFDAQSIEMFHLIAKKSEKPVHFFPLSISAYHILPPPDGIQIALGEKRIAERGPAGIFVGDELDLEVDPSLPKQEQRNIKAAAVYQIVKDNYDELSRYIEG